MFTLSDNDAPMATIKLTFGELPDQAKSLLIVMYVAIVTATVYLNVKLFDLILTRARLLWQNRDTWYEHLCNENV
jgi:hypothetical protein